MIDKVTLSKVEMLHRTIDIVANAQRRVDDHITMVMEMEDEPGFTGNEPKYIETKKVLALLREHESRLYQELKPLIDKVKHHPIFVYNLG